MSGSIFSDSYGQEVSFGNGTDGTGIDNIDGLDTPDGLASQVIDSYAQAIQRDPEVGFVRKGDDLPPRRLKNWLQAHLQFTEGQESPELFHLWSGLFAIASCLRRNTYMDRGFYKLRPNLYVLLIATSAECKKSTAAKVVERMLFKVPDLHIIKDKMTPEGLLQRMSTNISTEEAKLTGVLKRDGAVCIIAEELRVLFSQVSYVSGIIEILTSLYGCPSSFPYTTRHSPIEVHNACVNLLGASTPEWMASGMPDHTRSGGFLGRFVFAVAHKPKAKIAWPKVPEELKIVERALIHDLGIISRLRGEFEVTPEAADHYTKWYESFKIPEDARTREYFARKPDTILKLAMLLSVSTSNDLKVKLIHVKTAMRMMTAVEADMLDAFAYLGSTSESVLGRNVVSLLHQHGRLPRSSLIKAVSYRLKRPKDFDDVIATLTQEERITKEILNTGKAEDMDSNGEPVVCYRLTTAQERAQAEDERRRKAQVFQNLFDDEGGYIEKDD